MGKRKITVVGNANFTAQPDLTRVTIINGGLKKSHSEACDLAAKNSGEIKKIVETLGLDSGKLITVSFSVTESTRLDGEMSSWRQIPLGYTLDQRMRIDMDVNPKLLSEFVRKIGQCVPVVEIEIGNTISNPKSVQLELIQKAVEDAKEKALVIAKSAGAKLGEIDEIDYAKSQVDFYTLIRYIESANEASCCNEESVNIVSDRFNVSDTVIVTWNINQE